MHIVHAQISFRLVDGNAYSRKYMQAYMTRYLWKAISAVMAWSLLLCNGKKKQNALPRHFPYTVFS